MSNERLNYEDSFQALQRLGMVLGPDEIPPIPPTIPRRYGPEPLGINFIRESVAECSLDNLTLPRTYFGRSEIRDVSFVNTDLTESALCWNDFVDVDFTDAMLAGSDLRASIFERVRFVRTDLTNCDLRGSSFIDCDFTDAVVCGAKLSQKDDALALLTPDQRALIEILPIGEDPPGG
jgi:uncharacterized protein YjbI with pentapeptide repeats